MSWWKKTYSSQPQPEEEQLSHTSLLPQELQLSAYRTLNWFDSVTWQKTRPAEKEQVLICQVDLLSRIRKACNRHHSWCCERTKSNATLWAVVSWALITCISNCIQQVHFHSFSKAAIVLPSSNSIQTVFAPSLVSQPIFSPKPGCSSIERRTRTHRSIDLDQPELALKCILTQIRCFALGQNWNYENWYKLNTW